MGGQQRRREVREQRELHARGGHQEAVGAEGHRDEVRHKEELRARRVVQTQVPEGLPSRPPRHLRLKYFWIFNKIY